MGTAWGGAHTWLGSVRNYCVRVLPPADWYDFFHKTMYQSAVTCIFVVCERGCLGKKICYSGESVSWCHNENFQHFFSPRVSGLPVVSSKPSVNISPVFSLESWLGQNLSCIWFHFVSSSVPCFINEGGFHCLTGTFLCALVAFQSSVGCIVVNVLGETWALRFECSSDRSLGIIAVL